MLQLDVSVGSIFNVMLWQRCLWSGLVEALRHKTHLVRLKKKNMLFWLNVIVRNIWLLLPRTSLDIVPTSCQISVFCFHPDGCKLSQDPQIWLQVSWFLSVTTKHSCKYVWDLLKTPVFTAPTSCQISVFCYHKHDFILSKGLVENTRFCCHEHGCKLSIGRVKNTWFCPIKHSRKLSQGLIKNILFFLQETLLEMSQPLV